MTAVAPSAVREILKVAEQPEMLSFAGGLPAPELFPVRRSPTPTPRCLARGGQAGAAVRRQRGPSARCESGSRPASPAAGCRRAPSSCSSPTARSRASIWWRAPSSIAAIGWSSRIRPTWPRCRRFRTLRGLLRARARRRAGHDRRRPGGSCSRAQRPALIYVVPEFQNPKGTSLCAGAAPQAARAGPPPRGPGARGRSLRRDPLRGPGGAFAGRARRAAGDPTRARSRRRSRRACASAGFGRPRRCWAG